MIYGNFRAALYLVLRRNLAADDVSLWNETELDRDDEYNGLNIILLLHLIRHLMDVFSDTFLRIFGNLLAFPPDFREYVL